MQTHINLARYLVNCPDSGLRDGEKARKYAALTCEVTEWRKPNYLSTLAAACAECGDFDRSIKWQTKALELAPETAKDSYRQRLELYQSHKPYHQSPPIVSASPSSK